MGPVPNVCLYPSAPYPRQRGSVGISMADLFGLYLQGDGGGCVARGAQIDRLWQPQHHRHRRLQKTQNAPPGSAAPAKLPSTAQRTFMIMRLKRRAFVDKLDFLTSPGHLTGGTSRVQLGLPGGGPER